MDPCTAILWADQPHDVPLEKKKKKKGTLQQIQTEDQARFKKFKLQFVKETKCWNSFDEQNTINSETSRKKKKSDK